MHNMVALVGRAIVDKHNKSEIAVKVQRGYKNEYGEYDVDIIKVIIQQGMVDNVSKYLNNGDIVGIKGRLEKRDCELKVISDKVTFLASTNN